LPELIWNLWELSDLLVKDTLTCLALLFKRLDEINLKEHISSSVVKMLLVHAKNNKEMTELALVCLVNLSFADDVFCVMIVNEGGVEVIKEVLVKGVQVSNACILLSNLIILGPSIISHSIESQLYLEIQTLIKKGSVDQLKKVIWVLQNTLLKANEEQLYYLTDDGLLESTLNLLKTKDADLRMYTLKVLNSFIIRAKLFNDSKLKELIWISISDSKILEELVYNYNKDVAELTDALIKTSSQLCKESMMLL